MAFFMMPISSRSLSFPRRKVICSSPSERHLQFSVPDPGLSSTSNGVSLLIRHWLCSVANAATYLMSRARSFALWCLLRVVSASSFASISLMMSSNSFGFGSVFSPYPTSSPGTSSSFSPSLNTIGGRVSSFPAVAIFDTCSSDTLSESMTRRVLARIRLAKCSSWNFLQYAETSKVLHLALQPSWVFPR